MSTQMFVCPNCQSLDVYTPGEACIHCRYIEEDKEVLDNAFIVSHSQAALGGCPRCKSHEKLVPGTACLECGYLETDRQRIHLALEAQRAIPRAILTRCPKCKNFDGYGIGDSGELSCFHCGYVESDPLIIRRFQELRYRLRPLMRQRNFDLEIHVRRVIGSKKKYQKLLGLLLDYEYGFSLLFDEKLVHLRTLQNLYRILTEILQACTELLDDGICAKNQKLVTALKNTAELQLRNMTAEFAKKSWATEADNLRPNYPAHTKIATDYFAKLTKVGDTLACLNGMAASAFPVANIFWEIARAANAAAQVTKIGTVVLAATGAAENAIRARRDAKLAATFIEETQKAGETILDLPDDKQAEMFADAINGALSSDEFSKKWGSPVNYRHIKAWNDAAGTHLKGKRRREARVAANVIGGSLTAGSIIVTCGGVALILATGATLITVLKVNDQIAAKMDKRDAASRRKAAAASIVTAAAHGEENSIQLLRALELLDEPESAKYLIFSDIYVPVFEKLEEYLNPA
ncbi:MAG: hypothetical protein VYC39_09995 [Myxococcota bacterium]|nr:hypothetical protein [Myxococcota bacterium]